MTAPPALAAPTNAAAVVTTSTSIDVTWHDVSGEDGYTIERKVGAGGAWAAIGTTTASATVFTDAGITIGNTCFYRVKATNGNLESAFSTEASVVANIPTTPAGLSATAISITEISLTWNDVTNEASFVVDRRLGPSGLWVTVATLGPNTLNYNDANLGIYTQYYYRVRATNGAGSSAYSGEVSATTFAVPPSQTYIWSAWADAYSVTLYWFDVSYEDSYVVERRDAPAGAWAVIGTPTANLTTYADSTVAPATAYDYRIKAVNIAGESPYTSVFSLATPVAPPPPTPGNLAIRVLSATSLRVTWTDVTHETGYRVERRTDGPASWAVVATLAANETGFTDSGLSSGIEYSYRLTAFNAVGDSYYSDEISAAPYAVGALIDDDFDPGVDGSNWQSITAGVALNGGAGFRGSNALWFGGSGVRSATTVPLDLSVGGTVRFALRAGNTTADGATYWENSETGEGVVLEYSTGSGWAALQSFVTTYPALNAWTDYTVAVPVAARSPQTAFRWRQLAHSGPSFDTWALEDVIVEGALPPAPSAPPFIIASPSSATSVAIFWQPGSGARSYSVERLPPGGAWLPLATTPSTANYFTDTTALPETWYGYRIRAVNLGGASPASAPAYAQTYAQFAGWRLANFGQVEPTGPAASLATDGDGVVNLHKYAFNLSVGTQARPLVAGSGLSGMPVSWIDASTGWFCVEFVRRTATHNPGVSYTVEFSANCQTWTPGGTLVSVTPVNALWERVRVADNIAGPQRFVRVRISEP